MLVLAYRAKRSVDKDTFERTNAAGVQEFRNFNELERTKLKRGLLSLLADSGFAIGIAFVGTALARLFG